MVDSKKTSIFKSAASRGKGTRGGGRAGQNKLKRREGKGSKNKSFALTLCLCVCGCKPRKDGKGNGGGGECRSEQMFYLDTVPVNVHRPVRFPFKRFAEDNELLKQKHTSLARL